MQIRCRKQAALTFEKLGFVECKEHDPEGIVSMMDEEANYAHSDSLPANLPWTGWSGPGCAYGPAVYACDGKELAEVEMGFDGGAVVRWDYDLNEPHSDSLARVRHYVDVRERTNEMLANTPIGQAAAEYQGPHGQNRSV